jgi:hypothetical protein
VDLPTANLLAALLSSCAGITLAVWYVAPGLRKQPFADALTVLVWVQVFRYVALQIFSAADVGGLDASSSAQRAIAFGDLATAALALVAVWSLRRPLPGARTLAWLVAIVGAADLVNATVVGIDNKLTETATDWSWFILAFYVPFLWVATVTLVWQLITRRAEPLRTPTATAPTTA